MLLYSANNNKIKAYADVEIGEKYYIECYKLMRRVIYYLG